jgi:hypothetical protein
MLTTSVHSLHSSHREALLEHLVTADLMEVLWKQGAFMEVLKPQVDDRGYDLVFEANRVIRHVQLKASFEGSTVKRVNVNAQLGTKPSGCVVFVRFDKDILKRRFAFFGGKPRRPLPDLTGFKIAKHTKGNALGVKAERPNLRTVALSHFETIGGALELSRVLFGRPPVPKEVGTRGV